jgi:cysteine-rich repeat protein
VNLFCYCGVDWEELLPPASMVSADSVLDDGDFVVVRFEPAELDPEMADFSAFMALEVFDQTDSDTFPDDGFLVPVVWSLPRCGNGIVEYGELCDDGNVAGGDACPANCGTSTSCGNTVSDPGEECDDGGAAPGDGCSSTCQLESRCGNGIVEEGLRRRLQRPLRHLQRRLHRAGDGIGVRRRRGRCRSRVAREPSGTRTWCDLAHPAPAAGTLPSLNIVM